MSQFGEIAHRDRWASYASLVELSTLDAARINREGAAPEVYQACHVKHAIRVI
jgi:hypothetical protein